MRGSDHWRLTLRNPDGSVMQVCTSSAPGRVIAPLEIQSPPPWLSQDQRCTMSFGWRGRFDAPAGLGCIAEIRLKDGRWLSIFSGQLEKRGSHHKLSCPQFRRI